MVGFENRIFRKSFSFDRKKAALTTEIHFCSYFHFKWFPELRRAKRAHRRAKGERERERRISRTCKGRTIALSIGILPSHRSRSREALRRSRLRLRRAISPVVEPSRLSLFLLLSIWPDLMIFFSGFCLCFYIEEWMILHICLATEKLWENVTGFDEFFFLGFVGVSVLRNEWYNIFVWQPRKCEQQVENMFSMVFLRTQSNTRKYFSKHFLKCNQTHENIFLSGK